MTTSKQRNFFEQAYDLGEQRIAAGYGWPMEADPQLLEFLGIIQQTTAPGTSLDLGCGQGRHTLELARRGYNSYGIDFLERPINEAKVRAQKAGIAAAHFAVMDVLELDFPDDFFDVILDWSVLDHIYPKDWPRYVQNITRVLKMGGYLTLTEFSANDCRITDPYDNARDEVGFDYFFRLDEIQSLFGHDFEIIQTTHNETNTPPHFAMINVLLRHVESSK